MPEEWGKAVLKWRGLNAEKKTCVDGKSAPDANDEYLLYQSLIGAWDIGAETSQGRGAFLERLSNYIRKAIRESKTHTHWTEPNLPYEAAAERFIHALLFDSKDNSFLHDFMLFQRKVAFFGLFNSLAQVALKLTAPGVPDVYQGTELWDYNMVDPDNRRPVDYERRRMMLAEMRRKVSEEGVEISGFIRGLLQNHQNGQIKMYLVWRILQMRRRQRSLFERGAYLPIEVVGVVGDVKQMSLGMDDSDAVYTTTTQWHWADGTLSLVVKARSGADTIDTQNVSYRTTAGFNIGALCVVLILIAVLGDERLLRGFL
jgi:(1->4)-alpha-D-glucan 1-alpha-D-glucosylmutase